MTTVALAPGGTLRAVVNLGNPLLATRDAGGAPAGVSVDLARALAERLGVGCTLLAVDGAAKAVAAVAAGDADIGFFAVDPARGADIAFSAPYLLIEGCYLVRDESPLTANDAVDRVGRTVVVGAGSAYDLHLSRTLRHAIVERTETSQAVVDAFVRDGADVAAGVRQQLEADAARIGSLRLLPGRFMVIRQAVAVARSRGVAAAAAVAAWVEEMKAGGFVAAALERHGVTGATPAPAGDDGPAA